VAPAAGPPLSADCTEAWASAAGDTRGIPKVSVYLPDDLYRETRERNLPPSALTQDAIVLDASALHDAALHRERANRGLCAAP
jgi:post-segregation antitoxin (ccd killing protein)